jgi:hypothetical protein
VPLPTPVDRPTPCGSPDTSVFSSCACESCPACPLGEVRACAPDSECNCQCAVPTPAPTLPPTAAPTLPTPTATPHGCAGDCNGDGVVEVSELVRSVGVVLGRLPASACPSFAATGIGDLVEAVAASLSGCP